MEQLENRLLFSLNPTGLEQEMLELINRMRSNPADELNQIFISTQPGNPNYFRSHDSNVNAAFQFFNVNPVTLASQWSSLVPAAPLAWNDALIQAARAHSQRMIQQDMQSHQLPADPSQGLPAEPSLLNRVVAAGYNWSGSVSVGENVFAYAESVFHGHAAFAIDWGNGPSGIQSPPGHRQNIMDPNYREIGIGILTDNNPSTTVGPLVVTQDFGTRGNYGDARVLGVVFHDTDGDARYDSGEGRAGITITITNGGVTYTTTTLSAGGYQVAVAPGTYSVTASGGGIASPVFMGSITVGAQNVKRDLNLAALPTSGAISGIVYHDLNEDGALNGSETGLAGWTVFVDSNGNGTLDSGERSSITAANGSYELTSIAPGTWQVRTLNASGYRSTSAEVLLTTVVAGAVQSGVHFGKYQFLTVAGDTATFQGTNQADVFAWTAGTPHRVTLNGEQFTFDAAVVRHFIFHGREGQDSATITGGPGDDTAELRLQDALLSSASYTVRALGMESVVVHAGGGGNQAAHVYDSGGNDRFLARVQFGQMVSVDNSYMHQAHGFRSVRGYASGGMDIAELYDSAGDDLFEATPTEATLRAVNNSFQSVASGFDYAYAYALAGGMDLATLYDSPQDDLFVGRPDHSIFRAANSSFYNYALNFDRVTAMARTGHDRATLFDSAGNDRFVARPDSAQLRAENDSYSNLVSGFDRVDAYALAGGRDIAELYDSAGDDVFEATPTYAALRAGNRNFFNYAEGFDFAYGYALAGGFDTALLYDSSGDDVFLGRPDYSLLRAENNSYFNYVLNFDSVTAIAQAGNDLASLYDAAGNDRFVGWPTWAQLRAANDSYSNMVRGFDRVSAYATAGGMDIAEMFDSTGNDVFESTPSYAALRAADNSYFHYAAGFDYAYGYATAGGFDVATLYDSLGDDFFLGRPDYSVLRALNNSYFNYVLNFDQVTAIAQGGNDSAVLHDSAGDDRFESRPEVSLLRATNYSYVNVARGFDNVRAVATAGGTDIAELYDSASNDVFEANPTSAVMRAENGSYSNQAEGFDFAYGYALRGGFDTATLLGSTGDDFFMARHDYSVLRALNHSYFLYVLNFDQVAAVGRGGNDLAAMYDSPGDDTLYGRLNYAILSGLGFSNRATGFGRVAAYASTGTNQKDVQGVDYIFEAYGNWT